MKIQIFWTLYICLLTACIALLTITVGCTNKLYLHFEQQQYLVTMRVI